MNRPPMPPPRTFTVTAAPRFGEGEVFVEDFEQLADAANGALDIAAHHSALISALSGRLAVLESAVPPEPPKIRRSLLNMGR